jgi:phytoene desaturase
MRVAVVGGGLAGAAASVKLAGAGYDVTLFEKNAHIGGKMNLWQSKGYTFDMGPTILTMPDVARRLFSDLGRRIEDYMTFVSLDPQWRTFFHDGSQLDLYSSIQGMVEEMGRFAPDEVGSYVRFLAYSQRMYEISDRWFFWKSYGGLRDMMKANPMSPQSALLAMKMDPMTTMHQAIRKHFRDPRLAQIFEHFVQYVGSSPFIAPAILCLIPWVQIGYGCWYTMGGTGAVARGIAQLADELKVQLRFNTPIERIEVQNGKAVGVVPEGGSLEKFDIVVSNADIVRMYEKMLPNGQETLRKEGKRLEPACSGVVLYLGCRKRFPQLLHHDFFFSKDSDEEFRDIYERRIPHDDPTIYLAVPSRTDTGVAPDGCENIYVLVHTPYLGPEYDWETGAERYRNIILDKLERCGLDGLRDSIETERMITPLDLERLYRVNKGAIYGVVTQRGLGSAFKTANRSAEIQNLYLCGGSVNPGAGVPMVLMSGQIAADCVIEDNGARRESALTYRA